MWATLLICLALGIIPVSGTFPCDATPCTPSEITPLIGRGFDVGWSQFTKERVIYSRRWVEELLVLPERLYPEGTTPPTPDDPLRRRGFQNVRIRITENEPTQTALFDHLDAQIRDCLEVGLIPIIVYDAGELEAAATPETLAEESAKTVEWWRTVAEHYSTWSYRLLFNLIIELSGDHAINAPESCALNTVYENIVSAIRGINGNEERIVIFSPRFLSRAPYLQELRPPTTCGDYCMAEWHMYAAGPQLDRENKWLCRDTPESTEHSTTSLNCGNTEERANIARNLDIAMQWSKDNGILTWVGAWMAGNYNWGDVYTVEQQLVFAEYFMDIMAQVPLPWSINAHQKFHNRSLLHSDGNYGDWEPTMVPLLLLLASHGRVTPVSPPSPTYSPKYLIRLGLTFDVSYDALAWDADMQAGLTSFITNTIEGDTTVCPSGCVTKVQSFCRGTKLGDFHNSNKCVEQVEWSGTPIGVNALGTWAGANGFTYAYVAISGSTPQSSADIREIALSTWVEGYSFGASRALKKAAVDLSYCKTYWDGLTEEEEIAGRSGQNTESDTERTHVRRQDGGKRPSGITLAIVIGAVVIMFVAAGAVGAVLWRKRAAATRSPAEEAQAPSSMEIPKMEVDV